MTVFHWVLTYCGLTIFAFGALVAFIYIITYKKARIILCIAGIFACISSGLFILLSSNYMWELFFDKVPQWKFGMIVFFSVIILFLWAGLLYLQTKKEMTEHGKWNY